MKRFLYLGGAIGILLIGALTLLPHTPASPTAHLAPTAYFGGTLLHLEYALTPATRERGLGGRTNVPLNSGMLFVFAKDGRYGFWMKNTLVPLDMFWLNDKGHVVYRVEDVATSSYPNVFYPSVPARYVLETAAGFGKRHNIATGTPLELKNFPSVSK